MSLISFDRGIGSWLLMASVLPAVAWAQGNRVSSQEKPRAASGPGIIALGSPLTFGGDNDPDTFTATTTFSSTPVLVDNGALKIWQQQVPTGANGEWDIFYMQTVSGGPLANNISANWDVLLSYTLSQPAYFDAVADQFLVNGTVVGPLTNIGSICCAAATNPILPGWSFYNSGFSDPLPAGVQANWKQIYVTPYSFLTSAGVNPSTANEFVFALHFTLQNLPNVTGVISASAFGAFPSFAPGSWIEIYGSNLAPLQQTWGASDFNGVYAPTKVGQTSVTIGGTAAFVDYVSPLQVNVQVPAGVGTGTQSLVLTTESGSSAPFSVTVNDTQPGWLSPTSWTIGGTTYVVAQFGDGSYVLPVGALSGITSRPAKPGDTIVIYGIGFGSVNPDIPPGQIVQQSNNLAAPFTVTIGGQPASVSYSGLAPDYVGLYQFNIVVPNIPANSAAPITFSLNGAPATQKLSIAIGS